MVANMVAEENSSSKMPFSLRLKTSRIICPPLNNKAEMKKRM
jgi:hypothetical protein